MTARRIKQSDWYPIHCAVCIQAGHRTPATWIVSYGAGKRSYHACDQHRETLETRGLVAIRTQKHNPV